MTDSLANLDAPDQSRAIRQRARVLRVVLASLASGLTGLEVLLAIAFYHAIQA